MNRNDPFVTLPVLLSSASPSNRSEPSAHDPAATTETPKAAREPAPTSKETGGSQFATTDRISAGFARATAQTESAGHVVEHMAIGEERQGMESVPERHSIIGQMDRAHHLALVAASGVPLPLPVKVEKPVLLAGVDKAEHTPGVRNRPRAKAEGRCGANGYCDPTSESGCGGLYCDRLFNKL